MHIPRLKSVRAMKTPAEVAFLREASEGVESAMVATFAETQPGMTKFEVENLIHVREVEQGLGYDYAFIMIDADTNPEPIRAAGHRRRQDAAGLRR